MDRPASPVPEVTARTPAVTGGGTGVPFHTIGRMNAVRNPIRPLLSWALAGLLAATLPPAQAQRAITASSGGGGMGTLVLRNVLDELDPCMAIGGAQANDCRAASGGLSQSASIAYASDFGLAMGQTWTQVTAPTNLIQWGLADPSAALLRVRFDYSLRHNFVLGVGGRYDDAQGNVRAWSGYYVYSDVQVEWPPEPVNDPPLDPESFGNAMPPNTGALLLSFFHFDGNVQVVNDELISYFDQARNLRIDAVSIDFFHVEPATSQGGGLVSLPGTLALSGLALALAGGVARRRRSA